jgi:arsenate reductase
MAEAGIDISGHTSDVIDQNKLRDADFLITLCGDARDKCPLAPPGARKEHWGLPDPARATGTEEEILEAFRKVRDEIKRRVVDFLNRLVVR